MKLKILYEDKNVLVVDKPAGIIVHPGEGKKDYGITVVNLISEKLDKDFRKGERPGIVHRLDKDTSGVLIVAKNKMACVSLKRQFKNRKVEKKYVALVNGKLQYPEGIIDSPIARADRGGNKMRVSSSIDGREAVTKYLLKDVYRFDKNFPASLLEVEPKTGRTHQIRVHMAAIGHPVIGDPFYGNRKVNKIFEHDLGLKRQFLHSCEIKFKLPGKSGKMIKVTSKMPVELAKVIEKLTLS